MALSPTKVQVEIAMFPQALTSPPATKPPAPPTFPDPPAPPAAALGLVADERASGDAAVGKRRGLVRTEALGIDDATIDGPAGAAGSSLAARAATAGNRLIADERTAREGEVDRSRR